MVKVFIKRPFFRHFIPRKKQGLLARVFVNQLVYKITSSKPIDNGYQETSIAFTEG